MIALADLKDKTEEEIKAHIAQQYRSENTEWGNADTQIASTLENVSLVVAYESVGDYGCDSSSFFLFADKDGSLFDMYGSHCSCYGFEGQFKLEPTTKEYLQSDKFSFYGGGYDNDFGGNKDKIMAAIAAL